MTPKETRLSRVRGFHGCDYFPSWARTPVDHWNIKCPHDTLNRELGLIEAMGLDHVRVWLSAHGYEQEPATYLDNLRFLLDRCHARGLGVVMELFDSCGGDPEPPGEDLRIEEVRDRIKGTPGGAALAEIARERDIFEAPGLVPVTYRGDAWVAIWEGWVPNPGYQLLGSEHWPRWDAYAKSVIEAIRDHPGMVLLEVMNEPNITPGGVEGGRYDVIRQFYVHMYELCRASAPELPLSMGGAGIESFKGHDEDLGGELDVVSFHTFWPPDLVDAEIQQAKELSRGRPVYLSEWGYFPGGTDEEQLNGYQELFDRIRLAEIGWALSHIIAGYGPFGGTAILYPSGVMRPAGLWMRQQLRARVPAEP